MNFIGKRVYFVQRNPKSNEPHLLDTVIVNNKNFSNRDGEWCLDPDGHKLVNGECSACGYRSSE